ncbi:MAG: hypothetical protein EPN88_07560 [Bacteroidetes bacterium]|nr:MAG: hypothetical protein EPN88_07560 [Bacteroidota bacterium]
MKTIRYFAALLMLVTGIMHLLPMFKVPRDPNALPMLAFGIVYFTIGVLLLLNKNISRVLGIVFPLIGLAVGFFVVGLKNWDTMLTIMFIIDAVVVICCITLLLNRNKVKVESQ